MFDDPLVDALASLGIDGASLRAVLALPLVEVAWADGAVHDAERERIRQAAAGPLAVGPDGTLLVEDWLRYAPTPGYFARGRAALRALAETGGGGLDPAAVAEVVALATEVANAAGGFLGFGRVSREEADLVAQLRAALLGAEPAPDRLAVAERERVRAHFTTTLHTRSLEGLTASAMISLGTRTVPVHREGVVLGASRDADPEVVEVPGAEPRHCRVLERERKFYVVDLSAGGTRVDGERVGERRLLGGETLALGPATVVFKRMRRG